jgi:stage II sporulation protein D
MVPSSRSLRRTAATLLVGGGLLAAGPGVAAASTAASFYINGGGDGHGIGMSQYGALGMAQHGFSYGQILDHYYSGVTLSSVANRPVTVLLQDGSASFTGATRAGGKTLKPGTTYDVRPTAAGALQLFASGAGKAVGTFSAPLTVTGSGGPLDLVGLGRYRGALVFRPDGSGGVETVNAVDLEDYVRGVVSAEMPSSWPMAALEAQAVAARTYVLTSGAISRDFQVYSDTRSQMYAGVSAETPSTDAAIAATRGRIVTYAGQPAVTYFFASSGGHTESIQNVWQGVTPESWLVGVPDPYDNSGGNPYYRWKLKLSMAAAARALGGLVRGRFIGIKVTRRGVSPRVVSAQVVGSHGRVTVTGAQLQSVFGLLSTYMSFTSLTTRGATHTNGSPPASASGGAGVRTALIALAGAPHVHVVSGSLFPAGRGERVQVQELQRGRWVTVRLTRTTRGGGYSTRVPGAGRYRILAGGIAGSVVTVS